MKNSDDSCIHLLLQQICIKCLLVMRRHVAGVGGAFPNKTEALLFETYVPLREDRKYIKVVGVELEEFGG